MARRPGMLATPLWTIWLFLLAASSRAQTIMPSNMTEDLQPSGTTRFLLNSSADIGVSTLTLFPLTNMLANLATEEFQAFNITGPLVNVNPTTIDSIQEGDIAYVSCDDSSYGDNVKASDVFTMVTINRIKPAAIILYSVYSSHCNYSAQASWEEWDPSFTSVDPNRAGTVANRTKTDATVSIIADQDAVPTQSDRPGSSPQNDRSLSGAPTTATAMIILYAITGLITALFVVIIISGAVRAHRHPERYGPRNIVGRPRQSRARGVARAMLETIPIIKFGDPDPAPSKTADDIEMASPSPENKGAKTKEEDTRKDDAATTSAVPALAVDTTKEGDVRDNLNPDDRSITPRPDGTDAQGTLGCSICTEDFAKGQEVRVLPCNHKFHPDCVDPWLLNVSGTCPLCRENLNPDGVPEPTEGEEGSPDTAGSTTGGLRATGPNATTFHLAPPVGGDLSRSRRPLGMALMDRMHARRLSTMTADERLAAVRRLNQEGNTQEERPRLSERLRDRLRIRTRRQGEDPSTPASRSETPAEASGGISGGEIPAPRNERQIR